ncbi:MAG: glycosyltransferase family 4 protein [Candidatus Hodarchaeota archaeon]
MNICFFSQEYPPETHIGGIGTYTYNMASALAKYGHEVHVIASTKNEALTVKDNGVFVHRIKRRKIKLKELEHLYYSYLVAKKITKIDRYFDIVQSSEFASEAFWFSMNKKFPLVTRLATPFYLLEELNGKMFFGPRPLFNWMEKKQTLNSNGIFSSTTALAKNVVSKWKIDPSVVEVIPNSVDLSRVKRLGSNMPLPDALQNIDYLVYFGRLEERKGVCVLAAALPSVLERFPHLYMVFVGADFGYRGSPMRDYIFKRAKKNKNKIIFFDNLPHEELFPIVKSARIVILPSLWEAFGFVCVEAMALGRPVIATSGSGFEEIIENNISGYLIEPGNSELLAQKIINCLRNEVELRRISIGARERAQDFEVSNVAHKLLAYYEKIIYLFSGKTKCPDDPVYHVKYTRIKKDV